MAMASTSSSACRNCVACGTNLLWTPRVWRCNVCQDYLLCESCHSNGSLQDCEAQSSAPHGHNRDHDMSSHVQTQTCDGCESSPIWNRRWHCMVCDDFDLCEACYGVWDAPDMPCAHSKEHPMIAVEVLCMVFRKGQSVYSCKPAGPHWKYSIARDFSKGGFVWEKTEALTGVFNTNHVISQGEDEQEIQTSLEANRDNGNRRILLEKKSSLRYRRSCSEPTPETAGTQGVCGAKHKIFLSHAGTEKDFVEQLNVDLSRVHHFGTFFDKDDASLPKGEPFPERLLDAAKQCNLAIVVISDDYFRRKWPMLELAAFVEAQKSRPELKILPVFYRLSVEEFKQARRQESYVRCWNKWLGSSISKGDIGHWKVALKVVSKTNGIEYEQRMGEVAFRGKIVEAVYKRVKPDLMWDDTHVQGKVLIHDKIQKMIEVSTNASGEMSLPIIGLYGLGGLGKTTMCKVFCNQMMQVYLGRVCHIEFGSMDVVDLRKKLLKSIDNFGLEMLSSVDEGQALHLLRKHISQYKVCLVIDNVWDDQASYEEASTLLSLPFMKGSLILVASRSPMTLEKLKIKKEVIMKVPSLNMREATALFIHHTGCDNSVMFLEDQKTEMEMFVEQCKFEGQGTKSWEYHPLALKVLGTRVGPNLDEWEKTKVDLKFYKSEVMHPIFSILRVGYDALLPQYQKKFLDLAFSHRCHNKMIHCSRMILRLEYLHGEKIDGVFPTHLVQLLHAKSLVESYDIASGEIYIHDLYYEFARMEVEKRALQHTPRCSFYQASGRENVIQEGRLHIESHHLSHVTKVVSSCTACSKAEFISIQGCANLESIDISNMLNLKMFEVERCPKLRSVNLEGAANMQCLVWRGFSGEFPSLTSLESLERLWLYDVERESSPPWQGFLDFSKSSNIKALWFSYLPRKLLNLNRLVRLREVNVNNCRYLERFEGLESLVSLEVVCLKVCSSLVEFPSLANFPCLKSFLLEGAAKLKEIQGFASLTTLEQLSLEGGRELKELPGIESCTSLKYLWLGDTNLDECSWISLMKDLVYIDLSGTKMKSVPECSELSKLSRLWLQNCKALESEGNSNMGYHSSLPQNLDSFSVRHSRSFKVLPRFDYQSTLTCLDVSYTSVEDVSGVLNCLHLRGLVCQVTRITSLPDLSRLMSLEDLDVRGCALLTRMDNIKGLPALKCLLVEGCRRLLTLPDLRSSIRLTSLKLRNCPLVDPNSVKLPIESTIHTEMEDAPEEQSDNDNGVQTSTNEDKTSIVRMGSQELDVAHSVWGLGTLFEWVLSWCW